MACVENIPLANGDSEMEEGEIVDDVDDLSDISSEEEFLLRQRLQVLENYNNVLERKKAKRSFNGSGKQRDNHLDLSEISGTDLDDNFMHSVIVHKPETNSQKHKTYQKHKRREELKTHTMHNVFRNKDTHKKKSHRKKRIEVKVVSETSDESDDEYRNKRRKLADAVVVRRQKHNDHSSLQDRIQKMLHGTIEKKWDIGVENNTVIQHSLKPVLTVDKETETDMPPFVEDVNCTSQYPTDNSVLNVPEEMVKEELQIDGNTNQDLQNDKENQQTSECIIISTDDDDTQHNNNDTVFKNDETLLKTDHCNEGQDVIDSVVKEKCHESTEKEKALDSDEDLELLRQHALKTKAVKTKPIESILEPEKLMSEDEDSDTAELRIICLKSALLKKAMEMKRKQKLRKRLSQSSIQDDLLQEQELMSKIESNNNTDIESVDMDIGSDGEEKTKDVPNDHMQRKEVSAVENGVIENDISATHPDAEDELDEDEDLLRAKLLTSLSKNLPNLVDPNVASVDESKENKTAGKSAPTTKPPAKLPGNRIVINLGESDSEGEHEATKNLTKMHMKLSEQIDFQEKLDMFLKSTRMEVEKSNLPDVVQEPALPKTPQKFVAKTVKHLPKSVQIEYKNLVKRMAELEKIKESRQSSINQTTKTQTKETLKPRIVTLDYTKLIAINNNLDEQIALSRKKIAVESAKMLKLKDEATKLSQKYKIVATELKNVSTAITLNKKEQRAAQSRLSKIRIQHQKLLNGATSKHSKGNGQLLAVSRPTNKAASTNKMQKENDPSKEGLKTPTIFQSVKVNVVNDLREETIVPNPRLSFEVDVSSNLKTTKIPNDGYEAVQMDSFEDMVSAEIVKENEASHPVVEKGGGSRRNSEGTTIQRTERMEFDDYESPLQALGNATWEADPNAILCPFEVCGNCKDPDCKFLHPKASTQ